MDDKTLADAVRAAATDYNLAVDAANAALAEKQDVLKSAFAAAKDAGLTVFTGFSYSEPIMNPHVGVKVSRTSEV